MNATEIAETLVNGNISDARREILSSEFTPIGAEDSMRVPRDGVHVAVLALNVVDELVIVFGWENSDAIDRIRRCLDPHREVRD